MSGCGSAESHFKVRPAVLYPYFVAMLSACGNGPRLPLLFPPNPELKTQKYSCACYGVVPRRPAAWNLTPYPSAAAFPCSISDCLASSGRSGQTAIASRSSHHELRANASLFASPSYKSAVSPAFLALVRVVEQLMWKDIETNSGLTREQITDLAEQYRAAHNAVIGWCMGITHHLHGTNNVQMIANLALLRGMVGRRHAGVMPIRGHSNV